MLYRKTEIHHMLKTFGCSAALAAACMLSAPSQGLFAAFTTVAQDALDFTRVAEEAIPTVASIKVKGSVKQKMSSFNPWGMQDDDTNDFFKRFFVIPPGHETETPIEGQASGFLVSPDGLLLTNSHVVKDAKEITVILTDGREFTAQVIGQDPNTDIALIKIDGNNLPYLTLGNSDNLKPGQWAIAIGNPLGLQATLTVGVISATGRNNLDITRIEDFIQTDAAINRGNSGGPLLNLAGEVVGMNTAIVSNMGTGGYMGIGFAIPSNMLKHVMDELESSGQVSRGFLGITMQQMDSNLAKAFNLEKSEGALVADVSKDSPAEKAGIKQGDIILKYNNQAVNNIATLRNAIALMKPGTNINLVVMRDGKSMNIPLAVGTFPTEVEQKTIEAKENRFGFNVQSLTPEMAKSLGYGDEKGVIISKINSNSPAAWAGLKKGTLIVAVNQNKIATVDEFNKAVDNLPKGAPLLLLVKQDGAVRFVSLQVN